MIAPLVYTLALPATQAWCGSRKWQRTTTVGFSL